MDNVRKCRLWILEKKQVYDALKVFSCSGSKIVSIRASLVRDQDCCHGVNIKFFVGRCHSMDSGQRIKVTAILQGGRGVRTEADNFPFISAEIIEVGLYINCKNTALKGKEGDDGHA